MTVMTFVMVGVNAGKIGDVCKGPAVYVAFHVVLIFTTI